MHGNTQACFLPITLISKPTQTCPYSLYSVFLRPAHTDCIHIHAYSGLLISIALGITQACPYPSVLVPLGPSCTHHTQTNKNSGLHVYIALSTTWAHLYPMVTQSHTHFGPFVICGYLFHSGLPIYHVSYIPWAHPGLFILKTHCALWDKMAT